MGRAAKALEELWGLAGGDASALERVALGGDDPVLPTDFRIATAASAVIAAGALAADELRRRRIGRGQQISVDARAAVAAFRSERYLRVDGQPPPDVRGAIFGFYRTGDDRWIQIHGAMPHHREAILRFLGAEETREAVGSAVAKWSGQELEDALAGAHALPAGMIRSRDEWWQHEHGQAIARLPVLEIVKIGDSPPSRSPTIRFPSATSACWT